MGHWTALDEVVAGPPGAHGHERPDDSDRSPDGGLHDAPVLGTIGILDGSERAAASGVHDDVHTAARCRDDVWGGDVAAGAVHGGSAPDVSRNGAKTVSTDAAERQRSLQIDAGSSLVVPRHVSSGQTVT
jgi:hypothetical protein